MRAAWAVGGAARVQQPRACMSAGIAREQRQWETMLFHMHTLRQRGRYRAFGGRWVQSSVTVTRVCVACVCVYTAVCVCSSLFLTLDFYIGHITCYPQTTTSSSEKPTKLLIVILCCSATMIGWTSWK